MGNNYSGVWYDIGGTDDLPYSLAEYHLDVDYGASVKYYDSRGAIKESRVGRIRVDTNGIEGTFLRGNSVLNIPESLLISPPDEETIRILGTRDASNFRVYKRNPTMTKIERMAMTRVVSRAGISTKNVLWDPILATIEWNDILETIAWTSTRENRKESYDLNIPSTQRYPSRPSVTTTIIKANRVEAPVVTYAIKNSSRIVSPTATVIRTTKF